MEEREQRAELEHAEHVAALTQEAADLRRSFHTAEMERDKQCRLLRQLQEEKQALEEKCHNQQQVIQTEQKTVKEEREERAKAEDNWRQRLSGLEEKKEAAEEAWRVEREELKRSLKLLEDERRAEQEAARSALQENSRTQNSLLLQRLRRAEVELEAREERLKESSRHNGKLQARVEVRAHPQKLLSKQNPSKYKPDKTSQTKLVQSQL